MSSNQSEYSSTQVDFDGWIRKEFISFAESIPESMLIGSGRELEPHMTLAFGIISDTPESVRKIIEPFAPFGLLISGVSLFEHGDYDVVKADIICPHGATLREMIMESTMMAPQDFPVWRAHATFGYISKNRNRKEFSTMMDRFRGVAGMTYMAKDVTFSPPVGKSTKIKLKGI